VPTDAYGYPARPPGSVVVLDRIITDFVVPNLLGPFDVYKKLIPGGTLGRNGALHLTLEGNFTLPATDTLTVRLKWGATIVALMVLSDAATSAAAMPFVLEAWLTAKGDTGKQQGTIRWIADEEGTATYAGWVVAVRRGVAQSEESQQDKILQIQLEFAGAPTVGATIESGSLLLIPPS
jgi:hypothetical protein